MRLVEVYNICFCYVMRNKELPDFNNCRSGLKTWQT